MIHFLMLKLENIDFIGIVVNRIGIPNILIGEMSEQ